MTTRARAIQLKHQQQPLLCKVGYRRLYPTFASGLLLDFLKSGSTALVSTARLLLIWRIPQNMELMDRRLDSIRTTAAAQIRYLAIVRLNHGNGIVLNHRSQSSDRLAHSNAVLQ